jgi:hypothetical protein
MEKLDKIMDSINSLISFLMKSRSQFLIPLRKLKYFTICGNIFLFLWLEISVPIVLLLDLVGLFKTPMKSCTLLGTRAVFTIISVLVQPLGIFLAKLESWKVSFDNFCAQSILL